MNLLSTSMWACLARGKETSAESCILGFRKITASVNLKSEKGGAAL